MRITELRLLFLMVCAAGCGDGDGATNAQPDAAGLGGQTVQNIKTTLVQSGGSGGVTASQTGSSVSSSKGTGGSDTSNGGVTGGSPASTGGVNATGGTAQTQAGASGTGGQAGTGVGGVNATGGATQTAGSTSAIGGQANLGGIAAVGGSSTAAVSTAAGGSSGGTQPATLLGGNTGVGGNSTAIGATGGTDTSQPNTVTGGTSAIATGGAGTIGTETAGGTTASGGTEATGGSFASGGAPETGGATASGGSAVGETGGTRNPDSSTGGGNSGGVTGTGGTAATGGTTSSVCASGIEVNGVCWTCEPSAYDGNDNSCDCGCGVHDPDCDDVVGNAPNPYCLDSTFIECCTTFTRPGSCLPIDNVAPMDALDWSDNSKCMSVPTGWTCDPLNYADSICHCGCGVMDERDCANTSSNEEVCHVWDTPGACSTSSGIDALVSDDNAACNADVPARWTCDRALYRDGTCDCGCGTKDVDCTSLTADVCERCNGKGSCSQPNDLGCVAISASNNALCTNAQWTCALAEPGDGFCDCGCGMQDPDCSLPEHSRAECSRCGMRGSCAKTCEDIDSTDISTCRSEG